MYQRVLRREVLERVKPGTTIAVPIEFVVPDLEQHRRHFDPLKLQELANSIRQIGLQNPIKGYIEGRRSQTKLRIIAGERRLRALKLNSEKFVICHIENPPKSKEEARVRSVVSNLQRVDPSAIEYAREIQRLKGGGLKEEEVALKYGKSLQWVRDMLVLLTLAKPIQDKVMRGQIDVVTVKELVKHLPRTQQRMLGIMAAYEKQDGPLAPLKKKRKLREIASQLDGRRPKKNPQGRKEHSSTAILARNVINMADELGERLKELAEVPEEKLKVGGGFNLMDIRVSLERLKKLLDPQCVRLDKLD